MQQNGPEQVCPARSRPGRRSNPDLVPFRASTTRTVERFRVLEIAQKFDLFFAQGFGVKEAFTLELFEGLEMGAKVAHGDPPCP